MRKARHRSARPTRPQRSAQSKLVAAAGQRWGGALSCRPAIGRGVETPLMVSYWASPSGVGMKRFIEGEDRQQVTLLPQCCLDFAHSKLPEVQGPLVRQQSTDSRHRLQNQTFLRRSKTWRGANTRALIGAATFSQ